MKKFLTLSISAMLIIATFVACDSEEQQGETAVPVTNITLNQATATLSIGGTVQLTPTISPENASNQNVTWSSNNTSVATVNNSGIVTAISAGTAIITVTTQDGNHTARCTITVNPANVPVTGVTLPATSSVNIGGTITLMATVLPANASNQNVTWSSNSTSVATVNNSGVVIGVSEGTATITATTQDGGFTATSTVTVSLPLPLPMTGCNSNTPGWGVGSLGASFATAQTWTIPGTDGRPTQEWSDAVVATACANRTAFSGGSSGNFNANCRNSVGNNNFSGHYFSWCAVMRFADELCPPAQGWRVPTKQDFIDLDMNMGGTGQNRVGNPGGIFIGATAGPNGGIWGGARFTGRAYVLGDGWSTYWSSTESSATHGHGMDLNASGIYPQGSLFKHNGFAVRCVRN